MAVEDYFPEFLREAYFIALVLCFIAGTVGSTINNPVESEFEIAFTAYRLRQFDQNGISFGSRNYKFSFEAVTLNQSGLRRCQVIRWKELANKNLSEMLSTSVGATLVILPQDLLPPTTKFDTLEEQFSKLSTNQAVYFVQSSEMTENLVNSIRTSRTPTAVEQIYNVFAENAFQISSTTSMSSNALTKPEFVNIIGKLNAPDKSAPSIVLVAHYDSRSIVPGLAKGYDSNGSGMMALLSIMKKLSELYKTNDMNPKLNTIFALTALGSYNYRGSKQLAEELAEKQTGGNRILLVVNLESLLGGDEQLYVHISKTLQEKTAPFNFVRRMQRFMTPKQGRKVVIKSDIDSDKLSWEHELYFQNRISAFTLSHFPEADDVSRNSLVHDVDPAKEKQHLEVFNSRVQVITETLVSYIFGLNIDWCTEELVNSNNCHVIQPFVAIEYNSPLHKLASTPRPAVALPTNLVNDLYKLVKNYCHESEKRTFVTTDLQLYTAHVDQLVAHVVKPALFELVLAATISAYLFGIYHLAMNGQQIISWPMQKAKSN